VLTSIKGESNLPDDKAAVSLSKSLLIVAMTEASRPPKAIAGASQTSCSTTALWSSWN